MIVMGAGHFGVNEFAVRRLEGRGPVWVAAHWRELLGRLPEARQVFLGDGLPGLPAVAEVQRVIEDAPGVRWLVWAEHPGRWPSHPRVEVWFGELTEAMLAGWLDHADDEASPWVPSPRWFVWTAPPYPNRTATLWWMTGRASARWGIGGWVDADWQQAVWTGETCQEVWERPHFPYDRMMWIRRRWGWLIPAPPPWETVMGGPYPQMAARVVGTARGWIGWDLGTDLRSSFAGEVIGRCPHGVVVVEAGTSLLAVTREIEIVRLINPDVHLTAMTPDKLSPRVATRLRELAVGVFSPDPLSGAEPAGAKPVPLWMRWRPRRR